MSPGTVTRLSLKVKRNHRRMGRPLPMELQVHPPALTHTPVHPDCFENKAQYGWAARLIHKMPRILLLTGKELSPHGVKGMYAVEFPNFAGVAGYTHDIHKAMGHKLAAKHYGDACNIYQLEE